MGTAQSSEHNQVNKLSTHDKESSFFDSPEKTLPICTMTTTGNNDNKSTSFWSSITGNTSSSNDGYLKVLFAGRDHFSSAFIYTSGELKSNRKVIVCECDANELENEIADTHVVIPLMSKISRDLIEKAPYLNMIMQFGVGLEGVDIDAASDNGIAVSMIPSDGVGNAQSCAEHAIFLALSLLRQTKRMNESIQRGTLGAPTGRTIMGSSVMIYGFGNLGRQLTQRLHAFQPQRLVAVKRIPWQGAVPPRIDEIGIEKDLLRLSIDIDILFVCCSQNKDNIGRIDKEIISRLKRGAVVVNIARGGLLNYEDVHQALESGHLAGVAIDVYRQEPFPPNDPFLKHPRVVCTPHVAGVTEVSYKAMAKVVSDNVLRLINNQELLNVVNF